MSNLKEALIALGKDNPELRDHIRPVLDRITGKTASRPVQAKMDHRQAIQQLLKEFPDWPKGDLIDAVSTTSPYTRGEAAEVQDRYWELRGGRRGPIPGEYDYRG